jgi:hypothetical protein
MTRSNNITASVPGIAVLLTLLLNSGAAWAISVGQIDSFGDGTLQGWRMGFNATTLSHQENIADGGPAGAGDNFLQIVADGTAVAGGRLTVFNQTQWTGDYTAAGVTAIAMDLKNISSSEALNLRLAINGGYRDASFNIIGGVFATSTSITLDSGSDWTRVVFSLKPGDLVVPADVGRSSNVLGNDVQATLASVQELRLLNSAIPDWDGLPVGATLGIDNIRAVPLPATLALFGSGLVTILTRRRKSNLKT